MVAHILDCSYEDCVQNQLPTQAEEKHTSLEIWEPAVMSPPTVLLGRNYWPIILCVYIVLWVCKGLVTAYLKNRSLFFLSLIC